GHEQLNFISAGTGNSPVSWRHKRSIVVLENLPSSNSTSESIAPAQSSQTSAHCLFGIGEMLISTLYKSEPLTCALTLRASICKSTTQRLRTYVRPRGRRFAKSLYRSRFEHQDFPQNVFAICLPSIMTGEADLRRPAWRSA